jgi:hypothetical protein
MTAESGAGAGSWAAIMSAVTNPVSYFQPDVMNSLVILGLHNVSNEQFIF